MFTTLFSFLGVAVITYGATTISTNIDTGGTLVVSGNSTLSGDLTVDTSTLYVDSTNNRVGIGTTTPGYRLTINTDDATTNLFQVATTTNQGIFVINSLGNVGIGTTSPSAPLQIFSTNSNIIPLQIKTAGLGIGIYGAYSVGSWGSNIYFYSSRGTPLAPQQSLAEDKAANLWFKGYDGSNYRDVADIAGMVEADITSASSPGYLRFRTTPSNSTSLQERMRIISTGNVGIGITAPTALLHVSSTTPGTDLFKVTGGSNNVVINKTGNVGIGTTTPTTMFQVATSTANATTTIEVGKANQNKGSCLKMYDAAGTLQYVSIQGGSFAISATSCE